MDLDRAPHVEPQRLGSRSGEARLRVRAERRDVSRANDDDIERSVSRIGFGRERDLGTGVRDVHHLEPDEILRDATVVELEVARDDGAVGDAREQHPKPLLDLVGMFAPILVCAHDDVCEETHSRGFNERSFPPHGSDGSYVVSFRQARPPAIDKPLGVVILEAE